MCGYIDITEENHGCVSLVYRERKNYWAEGHYNHCSSQIFTFQKKERELFPIETIFTNSIGESLF